MSQSEPVTTVVTNAPATASGSKVSRTNGTNTIKKIVDTFVDSVDVTKEYTLDELKKLIIDSFKSCKKKKSRDSTEKKEPSKYNIFIKEEMSKIRKESPDVDNKKLMSLAAARWNEHKQTLVA